MFSAMLTAALYDDDGIGLRYQFDGKLFNLWRLQEETKVQNNIIHDFLFTDDCALNTGTQSQMLKRVDQFSAACEEFVLIISTKKIEVMYQSTHAIPYTEPTITVDGKSCCDLGSILSRTATIIEELNYRIVCANADFGRFYTCMWERRGISLQTKLKVYCAVILLSLFSVHEDSLHLPC